MLIALMSACTNSELEALIEGEWQGKIIQAGNDSKTHALPDGIKLDFEYPKYKFEGEQLEQGNYYIKNDLLHLIPDEQDEKREINILQLSADSLTLRLEDTLGSRSVLFLRH